MKPLLALTLLLAATVPGNAYDSATIAFVDTQDKQLLIAVTGFPPDPDFIVLGIQRVEDKNPHTYQVALTRAQAVALANTLKIVSTPCSAPAGFSPTFVRSRSSRPTSYIVGWLSLSRRRIALRARRYVIPVWHETHGPSADIAGFHENHSF